VYYERREPDVAAASVSQHNCRHAKHCVSSQTHRFALSDTHFSDKYHALLPMIDILEELCAGKDRDEIAIAIDAIGKVVYC
jgi:hypothetical protein